METLEPKLVLMRPPGVRLAGGGHDSDGWNVDAHWHFHDMHQILHAFDGSVEVEDRYGRHRIPHQFAAWIPAGTVHRTRIQKVRSGSVFLAADLVSVPGDRLCVIAASGLLREMVAHARHWPLSRTEDTGSEFFRCMASLCPEWLVQVVELALPSCSDARIAVATDYTRRNLATATLTQVCRAAHLSERSLRRKFRAETGMSWEVCRRRMRLLDAMEQLETTDQTVGNIAADIGYENQAAFAKAFRDAVGLSPTEYRRSRR